MLPELKKEFFQGLPDSDAAEFLRLMEHPERVAPLRGGDQVFLALHCAGLPVAIADGPLLDGRIAGDEKIGVVPEGVMPVYCESMLPGEKIISFANLEHDVRDEMAAKCQWRPEPEVKLAES